MVRIKKVERRHQLVAPPLNGSYLCAVRLSLFDLFPDGSPGNAQRFGEGFSRVDLTVIKQGQQGRAFHEQLSNGKWRHGLNNRRIQKTKPGFFQAIKNPRRRTGGGFWY
jgi:hypothetical protein